MTTNEKIEKLEKELQELKNEVKTQNNRKFKKGDFCYWSGNKPQYAIILGDCKVFSDSYSAFLINDMTSKDISLSKNYLRHATESEKKEQIEKLCEKGKDWDAEKLEIVDYRWRAEKLELFWIIKGGVVDYEKDFYGDFDNKCYESGNYFKTKELAGQAAEKVKELLLTLKHS